MVVPLHYNRFGITTDSGVTPVRPEPVKGRKRLPFAVGQAHREQTGVQMDSNAEQKHALRRQLRARRREHVLDLPESIHGLLFRRPPAPLLDLIPRDAVIGLYHATPFEAPASAYAAFFGEAGHTIALPYFLDRHSAMRFRLHKDPLGASDLEPGPYGMMQPAAKAAVVVPDVLFVPLIGFTADGRRLGQGGGHYDRWLAEHPAARAIGLAWDVQLCEDLPHEAHDIRLDAIVTPTCLYGPF